MKSQIIRFVFVAVMAAVFPLCAYAGSFQEAPPPPEGYSLVYLYRIKVPPSMQAPKILVDGDAILKLKNNSYGWFYLAPGSHSIKTKWGFMSEVPDLEVVTQIYPNQVHYIKLDGSMRAWGLNATKTYTSIKEVSEAEAMKDLAKVKNYVQSDKTTIGKIAEAAAENSTIDSELLLAPPPSEGKALIYLYRTNSDPKMHRLDVSVDNTPQVKIGKKKYTWFYVDAGSHTIQTKFGIFRKRPDAVLTIQSESGGTYYVRLSGIRVPQRTYDDYKIRLDAVTSSLAEKEMNGLKLLEP
ncbi:MAG: hypothetical protein COV45_00085 [Deltaproteobacteria bacterium CG11_big_fil_rev_8_21_14_0_20_47_16]|nr:MAG: hypothetical protein COV45_00085 [Deltaproteobacteria bacterium CG11_big_fil_rev_8_21_14_0_20_47_16]